MKAKLLLDSGKADQARQLLSSRLRNPSPDPELYRLLATAASASQHLGEAYEAQAEYHYRRGEADSAIDQMRRALTHADDSYSRLRRQARLDDMERTTLRNRAAAPGGQQSERYLP
jgi:predicted Zn-dependent protease